MISTSRRCLSLSGPEIRSRRRCAPSRIDVSGDRSSWDTDAKNSSFVSSIRRSSRAIALNERASSPTSSRLSTAMGSSNEPAATAAVAAESVPSDWVRRLAMSPLPSSARPTAAPSATSTPDQVRASRRATSACACSTSACIDSVNASRIASTRSARVRAAPSESAAARARWPRPTSIWIWPTVP